MLVLGRKPNERVVVMLPGSRVVITVVEIRGGKIRLGFEAPDHVKIYREELAQLIEAMQTNAPSA